ncbi:MAG TPA: OB-fold nucleic acid binding domain-containing protein [Jatrophihabitantaceae bacterium]|nr:OB-fold nucleic acid binding domain-containing protein [Jatrophihabitantaceae bacterium]
MGNGPSLLHRLTASSHHLDAAELREEVEKASCMPVGNLERGEFATVTGRLRAVVYTPTETVPTLDAELFDGTASIDLVWLGRRRIAGIEPGRRIKATGRVGVHEGRLAMYNPYYQLLGAPSD